MKLAVMQPYFLPYIGYFQLMAAVDRFVILDDVNFIKGGWLNRNRIDSAGTIQWLTIPLSGASPNKLIFEIDHQINEKFTKKTLRQIEGAYQKANCYEAGFELFKNILNNPNPNLADFARDSLIAVKDYLELPCEIVRSSKLYGNQDLKGEDRILDICQRESATSYVNLPGGRSIYDAARFESAGIELSFIDPQLESYGNNFESGLSILDAIMKVSRPELQQIVRKVILN